MGRPSEEIVLLSLSEQRLTDRLRQTAGNNKGNQVIGPGARWARRGGMTRQRRVRGRFRRRGFYLFSLDTSLLEMSKVNFFPLRLKWTIGSFMCSQERILHGQKKKCIKSDIFLRVSFQPPGKMSGLKNVSLSPWEYNKKTTSCMNVEDIFLVLWTHLTPGNNHTQLSIYFLGFMWNSKRHWTRHPSPTQKIKDPQCWFR